MNTLVRPEAVVFDLDGTLADTLTDIALCANQTLAELGLGEHAHDAYRHFVGEGMRVLAERALGAQATTARVEAFLGRYVGLYAAHQFDHTVLYPGIEAMLLRLRELGPRLAVLSNKPHAYTVAMVERLCPAGVFDVVAGMRDELPRKPAPGGAWWIAGQLGIGVERFFFVGDSSTDMDTARAAGMMPVGVAWGFRDVAELREHGARFVAQQAHDIPDLIASVAER